VSEREDFAEPGWTPGDQSPLWIVSLIGALALADALEIALLVRLVTGLAGR
jgi:hypothetical protein